MKEVIITFGAYVVAIVFIVCFTVSFLIANRRHHEAMAAERTDRAFETMRVAEAQQVRAEHDASAALELAKERNRTPVILGLVQSLARQVDTGQGKPDDRRHPLSPPETKPHWLPESRPW